MSTFMEEVFDNSEDATEKDLLEYDKYKDTLREIIIFSLHDILLLCL